MKDNIISDLNINTQNLKEYHNYISNLSENNKDYKQILDSISNNSSQKTYVENDGLNTYGINSFDKQIYNQLQQQQKNFKIGLCSKSLIIYSLDRPWQENHSVNRNNFKIYFTENISSSEIKKAYIYENNPYVPFLCRPSSKLQITLYNSSGFCWEGKYYPPYDPIRKKKNGEYLGLGKIIGEDRVLIKYIPPPNFRCNESFKNVVKIELLYAILPFVEENAFKPIPDSSLIKDFGSNINSFPYIILNIDELDTSKNNFGSNNNLDSSFAILAASDQNYSRKIIGSRSFIKFTAIQGGVRKFYPAPLASLNTLTFNYLTPEGLPINFKKDNLKIIRYKVTNMVPELFCNCNGSCKPFNRRIPYCKDCNGNIGSSNYEKTYNNLNPGELVRFPENENGIIVLYMDKYFSPDEYVIGDTIQIKNFIPSIYPAGDYGFTSYCGCPRWVNRCFCELALPNTYTWIPINEDGSDIILADVLTCPVEDSTIKTAYDLFTRYQPYIIPLGPSTKWIGDNYTEIADITKIENYATIPDQIPFYSQELLNFKEFINRPEGHTIIWTDLYVKNPNLKKSYFDQNKKCGSESHEHQCNICNNYWHLAEELYPPTIFKDNEMPAADLNYKGNKGFQRNTIYIYGPIDKKMKKKKNIISFEKWFTTLIQKRPPTNIFLPGDKDKKSYISQFVYPQNFYGYDGTQSPEDKKKAYLIDRTLFLNKDSWTNLIQPSEFLNWMTYFPPIYPSNLPKEERQAYDTFTYPNPCPLYSCIAWLILPYNPNAQLLSPQLFYLSFWQFTLQQLDDYIFKNFGINANNDSSISIPVCKGGGVVDCNNIFRQLNLTFNILMPCTDVPWGYTVFPYPPTSIWYDKVYPNAPNYSLRYLLFDNSHTISNVGFGSIANMNLQSTISLKITYNQADTSILYKDIKGII